MTRQEDLWLVESDLYALPVLVSNEGDGVCAVRLAEINYLESQSKLLRGLLAGKAFNKNKTFFFIRECDLKGIARQIPVSDLEDDEKLVRWQPHADEENLYAPDNPDAFYAAFALRCGTLGIKGPDQAKVLFHWMNLHMLDWLLNKQKPVDLYFCKLHPFPFRRDWKNVIFERDALLPTLVVNQTTSTKLTAFVPYIFRRLGEFFFSSKILGLNPQGGIHWTLDVELGKPWFEHVDKVEAKRVEVRGIGYWLGVMESLKRRCLDAMKVYAQWLREVRQASPEIPLHWDERTCAFVAQHRLVKAKAGVPCVVFGLARPGDITPGPPKDLAPEDDTLLPVSTFRPLKTHLRNSRTNDRTPRNR